MVDHTRVAYVHVLVLELPSLRLVGIHDDECSRRRVADCLVLSATPRRRPSVMFGDVQRARSCSQRS